MDIFSQIRNSSQWVFYLFGLIALLAYPSFANNFFVFQIGALSLILGMIALSLTLLAGYGGMVSLSQMSIAGLAGYFLALFGESNAVQSLQLAPIIAVPAAIILATLVASFFGLLSVRTEGVYTIMITLAVGVATFYFVQQNYVIFNGFQGLSGILPPTVFGTNFKDPVPFYYVSLMCAVLAYVFVVSLIRSPFGVALQGIRDNPRRMKALGYNIFLHRIVTHSIAGALAATGGVLLAWFNGFVSPGIVGVDAMINILIIAVIGGLNHPIGGFVGAVIFILLQNFAIDLVGSDRFRLLVGCVFFLIVIFSPNGLIGVGSKILNWAKKRPKASEDKMGMEVIKVDDV
ncbi:branched-chain amino acid ABC transporter permease [Sneathiella chungangensis]|uniref:Branched-chain amino acid ABC transporter permease n=1 Tax=Sneathiella chungangensis TaxID=1418234 RepID=A0A845MHX4_9PROT|nr:branched-chain amino acid ABC transporter permease [Sneathiella chungangensis]MZR23222.1 branched-chain amino acid ABC transporter permease [Sneathiella chungangensis]